MKNYFFILLTIGIILSSCDPDPIVEPNENYFPADSDTELTFSFKGFPSTSPQSQLPIQNINWVPANYTSGDLTWTYAKDTVVEGNNYSLFLCSTEGYHYLTRHKGFSYFKRAYNNSTTPVSIGDESNFLRSNLKTGQTWTDTTTGLVDDYTILFNDSTITVNGNTYSDVIGIKRINYQKSDINKTNGKISIYYYANTIGEIYSYEPYPISLQYQDVKKFRKN